MLDSTKLAWRSLIKSFAVISSRHVAIMILTQEQEMIRNMAREFARRRLAPIPRNGNEHRRFLGTHSRKWVRSGFSESWCRPEWGGANADYVAYALALEEIAAGDGAVSTVMSGHNSVGCMPVLEYGTILPKREISPTDGERRMALRVLLDRAAGRIRCLCVADDCRATGRLLRAQWHKAIHHHGQERRSCSCLCRH